MGIERWVSLLRVGQVEWADITGMSCGLGIVTLYMMKTCYYHGHLQSIAPCFCNLRQISDNKPEKHENIRFIKHSGWKRMKGRQNATRDLSQTTSILDETPAFSHFPEADSLLQLQSLLTICIAALSIVSVGLSCWENEEYHSAGDLGSGLVAALRMLQGSLVLLLAGLLIRKEKIAVKAAEMLQKPYNWGIRLGVKLLLICPTPIPFFDKTVQAHQLGKAMTIHLDDILTMVISLRLVLAIPALAEFGLLSGKRARFHKALHKIPESMVYSAKGWVQQHAIAAVLTINVANLMLGGFLIHCMERSIEEADGVMSLVTNGFWLVEISERTIGYGDLVPRTHIGRALITLFILLGIVNLSSAVGLICNFTQLSPNELSLASQVLVSKQGSRQLRSTAAALLQSYWKLRLKQKSGELRLRQAKSFAVCLRMFRFERTLWNAKNEPTLKERINNFKSGSSLLWSRFRDIISEAKPCRKTAVAVRKLTYFTMKTAILVKSKSERTREILSSRLSSANLPPTAHIHSSVTTSPRKPTNLRRSSVAAYRKFQRRLFHTGSLSSVSEEPISPYSAYV